MKLKKENKNFMDYFSYLVCSSGIFDLELFIQHFCSLILKQETKDQYECYLFILYSKSQTELLHYNLLYGIDNIISHQEL